MNEWVHLAIGAGIGALGLLATMQAREGGALEWLWVGGLICVFGIVVMCVQKRKKDLMAESDFDQMRCRCGGPVAVWSTTPRIGSYGWCSVCSSKVTMSHEPDFDAIALRLSSLYSGQPSTDDITEQLRLMWNARGAADLRIVIAERHSGMDTGDQEREIAKLDR